VRVLATMMAMWGTDVMMRNYYSYCSASNHVALS
jgi:hypothetical protein